MTGKAVPGSSQSGVSSGEALGVNYRTKGKSVVGWHMAVATTGDVTRFTKHGICMAGVFLGLGNWRRYGFIYGWTGMASTLL